MNTPKHFFIQFGIIISLYVSIVSFISFVFAIINNYFNSSYGYSYNFDYIRLSVSTLIISFPLFLWLSKLHRSSLLEDTTLKNSGLRKWLLYFTLFLAGTTVAIDLITIINTFLSGEGLTSVFVLKVLTVFIVATCVFIFYLKDLRGCFDADLKKTRKIAFITSIVVVGAMVYGFMIIGSPAKQRALKFDRDQISNLSQVQMHIMDYYQDKGKLPEKLSEVNDPLVFRIVPKDPETKTDYVYEKLETLKFKLCANFKTDSKELKNNKYTNLNEMDFEHTIGENCFERTVDKDRFPLRDPLKEKIY